MGDEHTYALLTERAPHARRLDRAEALAEITLRYFRGHGPATERDLAPGRRFLTEAPTTL